MDSGKKLSMTSDFLMGKKIQAIKRWMNIFKALEKEKKK